MNRFNRSSKKRRDDDDDDDFTPAGPADPPALPSIAAHHIDSLKSLGRPPRDDEEKRLVFMQLIRLKQNRKTHIECADILGISERSIRNYMAEPLYAELEQELRMESRQRGHLLISEVTDDAIQKLYNLMHSAKSEFVQYKSAEYILKVAGYEQPQEETQRDNQKDLIDFLSKVGGRGGAKQVNIQINNGPQQSSPGQQTVIDAESVPMHAPGAALPPPVLPDEYRRPLLPGGRLPPPESEE